MSTPRPPRRRPDIDGDELMAMVSTLPRGQAVPVALYYFGELTYEEIAVALDIRPASAKTAVQRGVKTLRERFGVELL